MTLLNTIFKYLLYCARIIIIIFFKLIYSKLSTVQQN